MIDGIAYAMSPAPGMRHQHISGKLYLALTNALADNACNCTAFLPVDYKVAEDTVVQPDVLVVCNPQMAGKVLEQTPALVAEVLSPSTALKDRNSKYYLYQEAGVPYYLIIDHEKAVAEVYQLVDNSYQQQTVDLKTAFTFYFHGCSVDIVFDDILK